MTNIHNVHDKCFRKAMADIRVAKDFLEEYLPETIRWLVNLNTLKLRQNNYVDEDLNAFSSDVLYEVKLNNDSTAYLYLLVEHQSSVDTLMALRLWTYVFRIWQDHVDQTGDTSLPLIYPMVFYHGKEPYTAPRSLAELIQASPEIVQQILFQPFHLVDTHDISDEELRQRHWAGILLYLMKHVYARDIWPYIQQFVEMLKVIEQEDGSVLYAKHLLNYWLIAAETKKDPKAFVKVIQQGLSASMGDELMSMAEQLVQQGIQQGIQQGMQQGESTLLMRLLERKFKAVPKIYRQRVEQANAVDLLRWGEKVLDSQAIEDVFEL